MGEYLPTAAQPLTITSPTFSDSPLPKPRITVIGSLNMDMVAYVAHHPLPGETIKAASFILSPGGKGANQAVACAKLSRSMSTSTSGSVDVQMVGAIGDDIHGRQIAANLQAYGVDTSGVRVLPEDKTGIAMVLVETHSGENRIVLASESNDSLTPAQFTYLPPTDLVILQLEIPLDTVLQIQRAACAAGVPVLLNPAPAIPLPAEAYNGLTHLIVNETEAEILAGPTDINDTLETRCKSWAQSFLARGVHNVLITLGGRGVYYATNAGLAGRVAAAPTTVVDTTAAGDTFVGAYALEMVVNVGKAKIGEAVARANRAAARTVAKRGAQDSIPWRDEL